MNGYVFGGTAAQVGEKLVCLVALRKVCFTKQGLLAGVEALHSCSKPGGLAHTCTEFFIFCGRPHFNSYDSSILKIVIIRIIVTTFPLHVSAVK